MLIVHDAPVNVTFSFRTASLAVNICSKRKRIVGSSLSCDIWHKRRGNGHNVPPLSSSRLSKGLETKGLLGAPSDSDGMPNFGTEAGGNKATPETSLNGVDSERCRKG